MKIRDFVYFVVGFILLNANCNLFNRNRRNLSNKMPLETIIKYEPEMVAPNIISDTAFEGHATLSPDGKMLYYAIYTADHSYSTIVFSHYWNGKWTKPQIAEFSGRYCDGSPCHSPDGSKLFFSSKRPVNDNHPKKDYDIWFVERIDNTWSSPVYLGDIINTEYDEFSPSVSLDGTLFFCSNRSGGLGLGDVYTSKRRNELYTQPVNLGEMINSQYLEGNVGVSPDGNLLFVMVQDHPSGFGGDDIYFSFKNESGWSEVRNAGSIINTYTYDFAPKVTSDGKILYFSSRISRQFNKKPDETAYTYESYYEHLKSPLNGFGNIYRIEIEKLQLEINSNSNNL